MQKQVPVIVLNWNNAGDTITCVRSLISQTYKNIKIIIGDNGSEINDFNIIARKFSADPEITVRRFSENLGFTKAHNILISEALKDSPDYVALLNNDAFAEPEWLESLLKCAAETGAGMVTSKMISYFNRQKMDNAGHFMLNTGEIIPLGHGDEISGYNERFLNIGPCAGACLYSAKMLEETGLFDEYFKTGYEDAELGLRAIAAGYKSVFEPGAVVYHKMSASINKVMDFNYLKKIQLNIFYSFFKIMPAGYLILNVPFIVFKFFAIFIIDIVFLRIRFLKMLTISHFEFLFKEMKHAVAARRDLRSKGILRQNTFFFIKRTMFFLGFDIKRFYKYIILGNKTQFEK